MIDSCNANYLLSRRVILYIEPAHMAYGEKDGKRGGRLLFVSINACIKHKASSDVQF